MRKLFIPTLVFVACAVPALAQDAPKQAAAQDETKQTQTQNAPTPKAAPPAVVQSEDDALIRNTQAIERSVQTSLGRAGYTDVKMIPTSFLVRAKDADGKPVVLVLGPEALAESNDAAPDQGSAGNNSPSGGAGCGQVGAPCPGADEE
jgi:hypothetical protein